MRYSFTTAGTLDQYFRYISDLTLLMKLEPSIDAYERLMGDECSCV